MHSALPDAEGWCPHPDPPHSAFAALTWGEGDGSAAPFAPSPHAERRVGRVGVGVRARAPKRYAIASLFVPRFVLARWVPTGAGLRLAAGPVKIHSQSALCGVKATVR